MLCAIYMNNTVRWCHSWLIANTYPVSLSEFNAKALLFLHNLLHFISIFHRNNTDDCLISYTFYRTKFTEFLTLPNHWLSSDYTQVMDVVLNLKGRMIISLIIAFRFKMSSEQVSKIQIIALKLCLLLFKYFFISMKYFLVFERYFSTEFDIWPT